MPRNVLRKIARMLKRLSTLADREIHEKCCAGTRIALDGDRTTVGLHRVFDDRQPEAGATGVSRPVLVDTIKTLENVRLITERDTHPIVVHTDRDRMAIAANVDEQP